MFIESFMNLDVALIQCSPPNSKGYCSLGVSVDVARSACVAAKKIGSPLIILFLLQKIQKLQKVQKVQKVEKKE